MGTVTVGMDPVAPQDRLELLDVVRGWALFGILASNMRAFNSPLGAYLDHSLMYHEPADRVTQALIDVFITGKFITIFSFLFGIGFAILMERARSRGLSDRRFFLRRMWFLMALGLTHALALWYGDILLPYGLMGLILYRFRNASNRKIVVWAFIFYAWPLLVSLLMTLVALAAGAMPGGPDIASPERLAAAIRAYSSGTFGEIFAERMRENAFMVFGLVFFYPRFLGVFLLGLWLHRTGLLQNLDERDALLRRCRGWGFAVGVPLNAITVLINEVYHPNPLGNEPLALAIGALQTFGVPLLSLGYVCQIGLWMQDPPRARRLRLFAPVGQTALSNYLLQTLICTTLFYSYGFALYGQVGPLAGLVLTCAIFGLQMLVSRWWVARFAFGPLEWIWRSITYLHPPRFRLKTS